MKTKQELLSKLREYSTNYDDDNIYIKQKIKETLLSCPELLYALHNKELECELFNEDGTINYDGEWDRYFESPDHAGNIKPCLFIPETQESMNSYVCYQTSFEETLRYDKQKKYGLITFQIFVNGADIIDKSTGMQRHDLIASIIREQFNWSNIFTAQTNLVSDKESVTDANFPVRTLIFEITLPNGLKRGKGYSNVEIRR